MYYRTEPNTKNRAIVSLFAQRMGLGAVPDCSYRSTKPGDELPDSPSLRDIAHMIARADNSAQSAGRPVDLIERAMSTSDFPSILTDVANKQLAQIYTDRPATFQKWSAPGALKDFKPTTIARLTPPGELPEIKEDDEYTNLYIGDSQETVRLKTHGGILAITRQTIVNDDLDAFTDTNRLLVQAATLTQSKRVVSTLTSDVAMSDGMPLFHADRGNLLTGADSPLSADSLAEAVAVMRRFADTNGQPLLIEPKFLIVGPGLERLAYQLAYNKADPSSSNSGAVNFFAKSVGLEVVVDPLIESNSLTSWYLLPDPALVPVIRYYTLLGGSLVPFIESQAMFKRDSIELKVRIDFGAAPVSTFAVKSTGA